MDTFFSSLSGNLNAAAIREHGSKWVYGGSVFQAGKAFVCMARTDKEKFLLEFGESAASFNEAFQGEIVYNAGSVVVKKYGLTHANACALRTLFPWTVPVSLRHEQTTIGCGDRLGLATAGHLRAVKKYPVRPILAQQSIRELSLTNRNFENVTDDVVFLVFQEGYTLGYGADGDHLKTLQDIDDAVDAGMTMITLDLSDVLKPESQDWNEGEIEAAFTALPQDVQTRLLSTYADKEFSCEDHTIQLSALEAKRCAVMYVSALDFAKEVYDRLASRRGDAFDLEVSIDETTTPTLPTHHVFFMSELQQRGVVSSALAPRFIGEFQKGIDYIGDLTEFEEQFKVHCAIARTYGNYKISVHSGSDKFSTFPIVGLHTNHRLHLKTAGTSWLEAVRLMTMREPGLYRKMHAHALEKLPEVQKYYHVTMDLSKVPPLEALSDDQLPKLMEQNDSRQLLHITYGPILNDPEIRPLFFAAMHKHEDGYYELIEKHFRKHIDLLGVPASD